jgi:hypothetical protein
MEYKEALDILKKEAEEERLWQSSRLRPPELFECALRGKKDIDALEQTKARLGGEVEQLKKEKIDLENSIKGGPAQSNEKALNVYLFLQAQLKHKRALFEGKGNLIFHSQASDWQSRNRVKTMLTQAVN